MVRISAKHILSIIFILCVLFAIFYTRSCSIESSNVRLSPILTVSDPEDKYDLSLEPLNCFLNRDVAKNIGLKPNLKQIECKKSGEDVWLPFSFLEKHYETRGQMVGDNEFEISQSYSKVFFPRDKHQANGSFMHFENFKVEVRGRVLCVSASKGVPLSTQWDPAGYFYPTQIAQFSLAHYGNYLRQKKISKTILDNGDDVLLEIKNSNHVQDKGSNIKVIEFNGLEEFHVDAPSEQYIVCLDFKNFRHASVTIDVEVFDEPGEVIELHYTSEVEKPLTVTGSKIVFGLGLDQDTWIRMTRDVFNDVDRARSLHRPEYKLKSRVRVRKIRLSGYGQIKSVWLSSQEHYRQFLHGANWFLENQDKSGGWPSQVVFNKGRKKYPVADEVPAGWYGAMCQGQAISVLVRAYIATGLTKYLEAGTRATHLFRLSTKEGGVQAKVFGYTWYQEYPTHPPSHILNGFLYGLLGLHDLSSLPEGKEAAMDLYRKGIDSLVALLPLFDSGSGTFYDLRHLTMYTAPKGARWDYHTTHINQLLTLSTVEEKRVAELLRSTAERWRGYMIGQNAPHN